MPRFDGYRVFILCEDKEHDYFVRAFMKHMGVGERKFYTYDLPDGACSAEAQVRQLFPSALGKIRKTPEKVFLVVVTDADTIDGDMSNRIKQMDRELQQQGNLPIKKDDRVLFVIPKKNIETWFAWLDGQESLDETTNYKSAYKNPKAAGYGKKLHEKYLDFRNQEQTCTNAPKSIQDLCVEFDRFCDMLDSIRQR